MKHNEILIGGVYMARVSATIVPVRVDAIREAYTGTKMAWRYHVTNLITKRKTVFRSASRFRRAAH